MASKTALAKAETRRLTSIRNAKALAKKTAQKNQHTLFAVGSAFGLGWAEARKFNLPTVAGLNRPLLYGAGSLILSYFIKDQQFRRFSESLADGMLSVAAYQGGRQGFKTLFAMSGEDDDEGVF